MKQYTLDAAYFFMRVGLCECTSYKKYDASPLQENSGCYYNFLSFSKN